MANGQVKTAIREVEMVGISRLILSLAASLPGKVHHTRIQVDPDDLALGPLCQLFCHDTCTGANIEYRPGP